jgi:putative Holliday junction resolvase
VGRVLGVDLGTRRIGLALSDPSGVLASPLATLARSGDLAADHRSIVEVARQEGADCIVVGLPLSLSGRAGPAARDVLAEVVELAEAAGAVEPRLSVETHDERLTTVTAEARLSAGGLRGPARRRVVDQAAAAVMLQSWLDRRGAGCPRKEQGAR